MFNAYIMHSSFPSKGDRLNVLSGWTPLRRNSNYGLHVPKSSPSLMSFCSPSYFLTNDCCFACASYHIPYFLFLLHFLNSPVLPVLSRTSPPIILVSMPATDPSSSALPLFFTLPSRTSLYCEFYLDLLILSLLCL